MIPAGLSSVPAARAGLDFMGLQINAHKHDLKGQVIESPDFHKLKAEPAVPFTQFRMLGDNGNLNSPGTCGFGLIEDVGNQQMAEPLAPVFRHNGQPFQIA
jgi:hypothetical protein